MTIQQKIYPLEEHGLDIRDIDEHALYIMEKLARSGHTAYLVGGSVRDLLLKKKPKDFDISTSARPEEIKEIFRNSILIGRRFRLAHIRFGKKIFEVSTFRAGDTESEEFITRDNVWGSPEEDVLRRDFTINGLFFDPSSQTVIDFLGGYPDIQKQYLRTIGPAFVRFKQDPVRMLRLVKFQARFGFTIDPEAKIALCECRHDITKSSSARILEELLRMLESKASAPFFRLMIEYGLLPLMLPALSTFMETPDGNEIYSYLEEIDNFFQEPHSPTLDRSILLAALIYPLFQRHLQDHYIDRGKNPHLGEIQQEAHNLVNEVFLPFFLLSRKLRSTLISVLTGQYRLTPLEKRGHRRPRVPQDPDFPLALQFLEIRSRLEPGLKQILDLWQETINTQASTINNPAPQRKRRTRRRRPS